MTNRKLKRVKPGNMGFSLVELIIVIAIMAILIAVLAPLFIRYVERSRISNDINAVGSMTQALKAAAIDPSIAATPPASITLTWDCGGSGEVTVTGDSGYQDTVHEIVGDVVVPQSRAARAAGAEIQVTLTLGTGLIAASSISIADQYLINLLQEIR